MSAWKKDNESDHYVAVVEEISDEKRARLKRDAIRQRESIVRKEISMS